MSVRLQVPAVDDPDFIAEDDERACVLELSACGGKPEPVDARRLVATPNTCVGEVVTVDSVEAC